MPETSKQTQSKRKLWDPFFKEFLALPFSGLGASIQTEIEVNRLPQRIDALALLESAAARARVRANPLLSYLRTHNLFEFKGQNDPLNESAYHRICMRARGYLADKQVPATELTLTIVSSRKPRALLTHPPFGEPWEPLAAGHYRLMDGVPVHLLVCNEVELVEPNYWLLLFASAQKQFRAFLRRVITEENTLYFDSALYLQPEVTEEVCEMEGRQDFFQSRLREVATTLGPKLLSALTSEERADMLARLSPQDRADLLARLPAEARADMLARLSAAERADMLASLPAAERADMLARLSAADRADMLASLPAAERADMLARLSAADRADMLASLPAAERADMLARLSPDERVKGLSPEERVEGLSPEERVKAFQSLSPAEIQNLSAEVRAELVRQLEAADNHTDT